MKEELKPEQYPGYEEKFIVINRKHLNNVPAEDKHRLEQCLKDLKPYLPNNRYLVCNQDEPYAKEVLDIILGNTRHEESVCQWKEEDPFEYEGIWNGTCGASWYLEEGTPEDNGMKYCPRCGKSLEQILHDTEQGE